MLDVAYLAQIVFGVLPKLLVGFLVMIAYIHLSGKGALAPISAIDQVGNVALGAIIGGTLFNTSETISGVIIVAGFWGGMLLLLRYVVNRFMKLKDVVDGEAVRLMKDGHILSGNFGKAGLSIRDFNMLLRQRGHCNLDSVESVWLEYNGQLTVVKKGDESTAVVLIENGSVNERNLERVGRNEDWLLKQIEGQRAELKDVFCAEWHSGKLWIYPFDKEPDDVA